MNNNNIAKLIEVLSTQYSHILGSTFPNKLSYEKIIDNIVNYYEDIINCMPGNVFWFDKNCIAVGCNKNVLDMFDFDNISQFKGLSFEGMGVAGNWTKKATQTFKHDTLEVLRTGQPKLNIEEPPIPHSNGQMIHFLTSRVPIFDRNNHVIGVVGISFDITELKKTQAALKKAKEEAEENSRNKSEFVANMSHDIKTPLAGIIGVSEMLSYRLNDEDRTLMRSLLASSQQLLNFFDNCLEVFKIESNHLPFPEEEFDILELVNEICQTFQPAIQTKKLRLTINSHALTNTRLIGNHIAIYRVLLNLLGNAVKFTPEGQITIDVKLKEAGGDKKDLILRVTDTGIGIPKDKRKIIFERFTRLIPSYKGIYEGSGIGLYVVHKFVSSMGGNIDLKSQEGKGSAFTVSVPVKISDSDSSLHIKPDIEQTENEPLTRLAHLSTRTKKQTPVIIEEETTCPYPQIHILLVEDNKLVQHIQYALLKSMNCQVEVVESGEMALEVFEPGKYDLIFMDIGLPNLQGDMTTKLIRKMESANSLYHVPVVALTAHTTETTKHQCLTLGIDEIINKPLSKDQVKKIFRKYL